MKKIWISPYSLKLTGKNETREGFLLKLQTKDFEEGFADCFPWQNFGDPSVDQLVEWIQPERSNPLLQRSLHFAKIDGQARAEKKKLLSNQVIANHYLVTDLSSLSSESVDSIVDRGFSSFKIKLGEDSKRETEDFKKVFANYFEKLQFRFDFNCRFTSAYRELISLCKNIEFVEDPT